MNLDDNKIIVPEGFEERLSQKIDLWEEFECAEKEQLLKRRRIRQSKKFKSFPIAASVAAALIAAVFVYIPIYKQSQSQYTHEQAVYALNLLSEELTFCKNEMLTLDNIVDNKE